MSAQLEPGARVRLKVAGSGDVDDVETHYQPGALGTVASIDLYGAPQGVAVTVAMDNHVVNVFDQGDGLLSDFFEVIEETPKSIMVPIRTIQAATALIDMDPDSLAGLTHPDAVNGVLDLLAPLLTAGELADAPRIMLMVQQAHHADVDGQSTYTAQVRAVSLCIADVTVEATSETAARTEIERRWNAGEILFDHNEHLDDFQIESISKD